MLIGKQISGLLLLFSSKKVYCHCGARHNAEMGLCGTVYKCIEILSIKRDHSVLIHLRNLLVHLQNLCHFNTSCRVVLSLYNLIAEVSRFMYA